MDAFEKQFRKDIQKVGCMALIPIAIGILIWLLWFSLVVGVLYCVAHFGLHWF